MELPTPKEFSWFYTLKPCQGNFGFYYFSKWVSKGLRAFIEIKDNPGKWKDAYFYTYDESVRGSFVEPSKFPVVISFRVREWPVGLSNTRNIIVRRRKPSLSENSLHRCHTVSGLSETDRT